MTDVEQLGYCVLFSCVWNLFAAFEVSRLKSRLKKAEEQIRTLKQRGGSVEEYMNGVETWLS